MCKSCSFIMEYEGSDGVEHKRKHKAEGVLKWVDHCLLLNTLDCLNVKNSSREFIILSKNRTSRNQGRKKKLSLSPLSKSKQASKTTSLASLVSDWAICSVCTEAVSLCHAQSRGGVSTCSRAGQPWEPLWFCISGNSMTITLARPRSLYRQRQESRSPWAMPTKLWILGNICGLNVVSHLSTLPSMNSHCEELLFR